MNRPLVRRIVASLGVTAVLLTPAGMGSAQEKKVDSKIERGFVDIEHPKALGLTRIPVERVYLGKYYKPNVVRLPNNELRLVGMDCEPNHDFYQKNEHPIFRSADGGLTWSKLAPMEVGHGEPYLVVLKNGTLLATGGDTTPGGVRFLHHSADQGRTWTTPPTGPAPKGQWACMRNILELADGSLLAGISEAAVHGKDIMWRSFDGGRTWSENYPAHFADAPKNYPGPLSAEAYLWQARSGKIYAILRVGMTNSWPLPGTTDPGINDHSERMVVYSTTDLGHNWQKVRDMGYYGEYYPSILRMRDGRLLLTFTMREPFGPNVFPHGLRAVVGRETDDGFEFDLRHDRILLDTKSPRARWPISWGGSIGGTVQLDDGTLVSAYAYGGFPGGDMKKNVDMNTEVIRWKL
jgi:hypothetical protein